MISEDGLQRLQVVLIGLAEELRAVYVMAHAALNEVSALRETVRALDPAFADVLEQKRLEIDLKNAVAHQKALTALEGMTRLAKESVVTMPST